MQKRPPSPTRGSARVDAILRYRSASEGVLCSTRCRELSRTGLTATVDRPVIPGELLRFDLELPSGGPSVLGLGRVAWTGSDPEGVPSTSLMRIRFISLGEASETTLFAWLDEISAVAERPSSPHDDSSVRELSRAIADSLLPPPPVLPGAPSSDASANPPPLPSQRASASPSAPAAKAEPVRESPATLRTAEVRARLSQLQRRRDQTPLVVPLPLGALINAPPFGAAIAPPFDESPQPERRTTIAPPASIPEMPPLRVSSPAFDEPERASLPIDGPSLPLSDAPWSVPALALERTRLAHPWLLLGVASLAVGAALAYLVYGPARMQRTRPQAAAPLAEHASSHGPAEPAAAAERDRAVALGIADSSIAMLDNPEPQADPFGRGAAWKPLRTKLGQAPKPPPAAPSAPAPVAVQPAMPAAIPGAVVPPPPPALPAVLATPAAPPSKLERARACLARGDNDCAATLLKGANSEPELELWIETLRAQGRATEARRDMQRYLDIYPQGRRSTVYGRILSHTP